LAEVLWINHYIMTLVGSNQVSLKYSDVRMTIVSFEALFLSFT
jgi:hypothetical protein